MTGEEAGQRATTSWDSPLVKRRNNLIERKIALRADECENLPRPNYTMLFVLGLGANMNWRELLVPTMMHYLSRYQRRICNVRG